MIWQYQTLISTQLYAWSAFSVFGGLGVWLLSEHPFWYGVGLQCVVWGVIDALIAFFGQFGMRRKLADLDYPEDRHVQRRETRRLRRLLLINAGLDVLYIAAGVTLIFTLGRDDVFARGNGVGIVIQGAYLLFFDLFHGWQVGRVVER